jgi:hypothetical protein
VVLGVFAQQPPEAGERSHQPWSDGACVLVGAARSWAVRGASATAIIRPLILSPGAAARCDALAGGQVMNISAGNPND